MVTPHHRGTVEGGQLTSTGRQRWSGCRGHPSVAFKNTSRRYRVYCGFTSAEDAWPETCVSGYKILCFAPCVLDVQWPISIAGPEAARATVSWRSQRGHVFAREEAGPHRRPGRGGAHQSRRGRQGQPSDRCDGGAEGVLACARGDVHGLRVSSGLQHIVRSPVSIRRPLG